MIETTEDTLLGGRLSFRQPVAGYRAAIDPVLLAAAVPAKPGDRIFEMGVGTGAASLCLMSRVPDCVITGTEINEDAASLAQNNALLNGFDGRLTVVPSADASRALPGVCQHAFSNPPYWAEGTGNKSHAKGKALANQDAGFSIERWVSELCRPCRHRASVTVIFPAARVADLLTAFSGRVGSLRLFPLWPKAGRTAKRIIVQGRVGGKGPSEVCAGLVLHQDDGAFTRAAEDILREGAPLAW